jgi:predicted nucleic acid-binding protein
MKILDTSAWIEYFGATRRGEAVRDCVDGGEEIVIPDVVLAELARKLKRERVKDEEVKRVLYFVSSRSRVEAIDVELALLSAVRWVELDRRGRECDEYPEPDGRHPAGNRPQVPRGGDPVHRQALRGSAQSPDAEITQRRWIHKSHGPPPSQEKRKGGTARIEVLCFSVPREILERIVGGAMIEYEGIRRSRTGVHHPREDW